jgi:hypothetical protein
VISTYAFLPVLRDPQATVKESALSFVGNGTSLRTAGWTYTLYKDGSEELYDMKLRTPVPGGVFRAAFLPGALFLPLLSNRA